MTREPVLGFVLLALGLSCAVPSAAQVSAMVIAAGTPEDQALQEISQETDAGQKAAKLEKFVQTFSANPAAVAYGNAQLSQLAQDRGDTARALEYGERALAAMPNNMELVVSQVTLAMSAKQRRKVVEYALAGGAAYNGIGSGPRPENVSEEVFAQRAEESRREHESSYQFLESAAFNSLASVEDPGVRVDLIEKYGAAFPNSQFADQVSQLALIALQQLNDRARMTAYGEKLLAANPNSIPVLILMADSLGNDARTAAKAVEYARRAVALTEKEGDDDRGRKLLGASARSVLGGALLTQGNTSAAVSELQKAEPVLAEDPASHSVVLYRLGFALAKLRRYTESRQVLMQAVNVDGPAQELARDLLVKVNAARAKGQ
ncbi:MAG: tetratricopeptide repeat protein [Terriglobales bacterium]